MERNFIDEELKPFESLEGKLLVASQSLDGTCFEKALIYICAHDDQGAIGIIINNKIGSFYIQDYINKAYIKKNFKNKKIPIMFGGPIERDRLIILSITREQERVFERLQCLTVYTESTDFLRDCASGKVQDKFIAAKGFAAWDPFQLEQELQENFWLISHASLEILFSQKIKNKWQRVVETIGVKNFTHLVNYTGNA